MLMEFGELKKLNNLVLKIQFFIIGGLIIM